eukprot:SAG22_NODE_16175_length_331_cov_0.892241_1_plen_28_part_10
METAGNPRTSIMGTTNLPLSWLLTGTVA